MRPLLVASLAALLAVPATASAAQVTTDRQCYLDTSQTTVTVNGMGFAASTAYTALLDGKPLGSDTTTAQGAMQAAIKPQALGEREQQRRFVVSVQADQTASAPFYVTRFLAGFAPTKGNPATMHVRFAAYGFGLGDDHPDVYLHYVAPGGRLIKTLRLGEAQGPCGTITRTRKRRLFPFAHPRHGKWRLQFDTAKRYRHGVKGSRFLFYTVGVSVRAAG